MARKIRSNDEVIVLSGKNKGKRGRVRCILSRNRAIVTGINLIKKHQKSVPSSRKVGGILEKEAPIDISNLAIFNVDLFKADRIGFKLQNGKKFRVLKSNGKVIE